jgi:hypothetical protein
MSVVPEFSIPAREFTLGRVLAGPPVMYCELERIVPTGEMTMPFVWVTGDDHEAFAESVRGHDIRGVANPGHRRGERVVPHRVDGGADDYGVAYPNPLEFAPVVQGDPGRSRRIAMAHAHLPKLDDMGIVEWDWEAKELSKGQAWDEIEPLLRWMVENRDELPEGWLPEGAVDYDTSDDAAGAPSES